MSNHSSPPGLQAALDYAASGYRVLPVSGKRPLLEDWPRAATADAAVIREWWERWPHAGVGVCTGEIRSGRHLVVLDVDGEEGIDSLHELERRHGELPTTASVKTPRGEHFWFASTATVATSAGKLGPGLDVRGTGGYVVVPPGEGREWDVPLDEQDPTELPAWLAASGGRHDRAGREPGTPIPEGTRNSTLMSIAGSMRRVGFSVAAIEAALLVTNRERCRPPLDDSEVRRIAASVGRYPAGVPKVATARSADAARELGDLLALPSVGLAVAGTRIVGRGREAIGAIMLSNGDEIVFPKLSVAMSAASLMEQVVATVGAEPALKNEQARHTVALMRGIGELCESDTARQQAAEWGRSFLAVADCLDVDLDDQAQRWDAFSRLGALDDPTVAARRDSTSIARQCLVLRALDGTLYVRSGWFAAHVRSEDHTVPLASVPARMLDAGWGRPGSEGRVHAREPGFGGSVVQKFLTVPPDWDPPPLVNAGEHPVAGERVNAGEQTNARARACARVHIHQRSPVHQHENDDPALAAGPITADADDES